MCIVEDAAHLSRQYHVPLMCIVDITKVALTIAPECKGGGLAAQCEKLLGQHFPNDPGTEGTWWTMLTDQRRECE